MLPAEMLVSVLIPQLGAIQTSTDSKFLDPNSLPPLFQSEPTPERRFLISRTSFNLAARSPPISASPPLAFRSLVSFSHLFSKLTNEGDKEQGGGRGGEMER